MNDKLPQNLPDWDLYHALREQWTHEDNLVNHRLMWLILSQGLLFTAYGTLTIDKHRWLVYGFPVFGMAVAAVILPMVSDVSCHALWVKCVSVETE